MYVLKKGPAGDKGLSTRLKYYFFRHVICENFYVEGLYKEKKRILSRCEMKLNWETNVYLEFDFPKSP